MLEQGQIIRGLTVLWALMLIPLQNECPSRPRPYMSSCGVHQPNITTISVQAWLIII